MSTKIKQSDFQSVPRQAKRLDERHNGQPFEVELSGMKITVDRGVYQTSGDSELMAEIVEINKDQDFLEIGCGTGIISIAVAKRARHGTGVDINKRAVENSKKNAEEQGVKNIDFLSPTYLKM